MSAIREKIEARLDELEALMKARNYAEAEELIPSITKFTSVRMQLPKPIDLLYKRSRIS